MRDWQPFLGLPLWIWLFVLPTLFAGYCMFQRETAGKFLRPVWRVMDRIYFFSGLIAACSMVLILLLIIAQMVTRWSGITFPGGTEFAGYAMAATSFFALAHALMHGAHIRVSILLNINAFIKFWLDVFATLLAAIIATYFARFAIKTNFVSEMLNDRTQGQDLVPEWVLTFFSMFANAPTKWAQLWADTGSEWVYTPVWLPQLPMSIGTVLLAVAIWDSLTRLVVNGETSIKGETVE